MESFIDLLSMTKRLMDEKQQPSVTQGLGRLFSSISSENSELLRVGDEVSSASATDRNNTSFGTRSTTKQGIGKIWGSKATSKKSQKPMSHKTSSGKTPSIFAVLSFIKPSDGGFVTWFMSFLKFDLP